MDIEELDLNNFDIAEVEIDEALEENFKNIIYSQPFYSNDEYDFEFRVTFDNTNIILDEVKYSDHSDFENCVELHCNLVNISFETAKHFIKNNIDIRDKKTVLDSDILHILDEKEPNYHLLLEENKKVILKDVYKDIKEVMLI